MRAGRRVGAIALVALLLAGCTGGGPILANPPQAFDTPPPPSPGPTSPGSDPIPVELPRDDGPHSRLTEWWYYTGHLKTVAGRRFGFEAVIFRAERSSVPVAWASHLALTDEQGNAFHYAQRSEIGPQVDRSPRDAAGTPTGFDLQVSGLSPALIATGAPAMAATPWRLAGGGGQDFIDAGLTPEEATAAGASFSLNLDLRELRDPAFHEDDGFVDFGPAGSSYYYSRTRMAAIGLLTLDGTSERVEGSAWFDHQWGDFVSVGGGGWDWFAINLDDGTDITVSSVLDADRNRILIFATVVPGIGDGPVRHVGPDEVEVIPAGPWVSPRTGYTWQSGWTVRVEGLIINLTPTVQDQELDTRATTGVVYWEGSQHVEAFPADVAAGDGPSMGGEAYVEMTRYSQ
jgi:predicted secreted hydrolase